jgi:hypothetical protein
MNKEVRKINHRNIKKYKKWLSERLIYGDEKIIYETFPKYHPPKYFYDMINDFEAVGVVVEKIGNNKNGKHFKLYHSKELDE